MAISEQAYVNSQTCLTVDSIQFRFMCCLFVARITARSFGTRNYFLSPYALHAWNLALSMSQPCAPKELETLAKIFSFR
jgi:hypothetical protein